MDADTRIKLALGTQYVEGEMLRDQVTALTKTIAERDATIAALNRTVADLNSGAVVAADSGD